MHPDTQNNLKSVSAFYLNKRGYWHAAEKLSLSAAKGYGKRLDRTHRPTLYCGELLASLLAEYEYFEEAKKMYRSLLEGFQELMGYDHDKTLETICSLVSVLDWLGQYQAQEELKERLVKAYTGRLGRNHPQTLKNLFELASLQKVQGKYKEAEETSRSALERLEEATSAPRESATQEECRMLHECRLFACGLLATAPGDLRQAEEKKETEDRNRHVPGWKPPT